MNATLDGNKCRDVAEAYRNDAMANTSRTQSKKGPTKHQRVMGLDYKSWSENCHSVNNVNSFNSDSHKNSG